MKKPRYLIMALACLSISFLGTAHCDAAAIGNATYGLLSETYDGIDYNPNGTTIDLGYLGAWVWPANSTAWPVISADTTTYTEGGNSLKIAIPDMSYCGIYIQFGSSTTDQQNIPMTAYDGGSLDFDVRSNCDLEIKIEWGPKGTGASVKLSKPTNPNVWQHVSIPLSSFAGINLSTIRCPVVISPHETTYTVPGRQYRIDNVVWRKSSTGTVDFSLKNVSDGSPASKLTWSGIDLGNTRWKAADQYLELDITSFSGTYREDIDAWPYGVQIYTDNTNAAAVPRYTHTGDPAGLVDTSTGTRTLPMCWRIVDKTTTTHIMQGATGAPSRLWESQLTDQYPCYIWMRDKHSSDFPVNDSYTYATAWDYRGIQHAEMTFGGSRSPNYVYFGADFSHAVGLRSYSTSRLTVEFYNE